MQICYSRKGWKVFGVKMSEEKNGGKHFVKSLCLKFLLEMPSQTRSPDGDDLIGVFSSWAIQNIQVGYPRKQEFHIRYNKQTTMVENNDHLL